MAPSIFDTSNQPWVFLFTIYGGVAMGVLFDVLEIIRSALGGKRIMTVLFDIVYWIVVTALAFGLLYYACEGEFHYYDALGFALGAGLWFLGPSKAVKWVKQKVAHGMRALWNQFKLTWVYRMIAK